MSAFLDHVQIWSLLYMRELPPVFVGGTANHERFLEVFLSLCSDFHDRIVSDFHAVLPENPKIRHPVFSALSLGHRDFPRFLQSFQSNLLQMMTYSWSLQCYFKEHYSEFCEPISIFPFQKLSLSKMHFFFSFFLNALHHISVTN